MKVYNLTDVATSVLEQRGLVAQGIATSGRIVNPGEYVDVEDTVKSRADLEYLIQVGAVAIDQMPPPYVRARQQAQASAGTTGRVPQHVHVEETKIAGEPPLSPPAEGATMVLGKDDPSTHVPDEPPAPPQPEDPPPLQPPVEPPAGGQAKNKKR